MDSPGSSLSSVSTTEATSYLKDILKLGREDDTVNTSKGDQAKPSSSMDSMMPMEEVLKCFGNPTIAKQQIWLVGNDHSNSFPVYSQDVTIIASNASSDHSSPAGGKASSSNKIQVNPVVKFEWEHKYYVGNLVATHRNGIHIAYVIKGKSDGVVRIINRKTAERVLLKGFIGNVADISFAHMSSVYLGAVDERGNMFVYEIIENNGLSASLVLQVDRPHTAQPSEYHRLVWCPYIPDEEETSGTTHNTTDSSSVLDDISKLLVLTHNTVAEIWNIDTVVKECGEGSAISPDDVENGYVKITNHTDAITDAAFSPDGTALATSSVDGEVKFFQVYLHSETPPRCLHQWKPHGGKPVSSIFFLDDHQHPNPEVQFWKFAVTGCDHNREIKLWSCESWLCLQTIRFDHEVLGDRMPNMSIMPCIKASMDLSANYLILSDIRRKVLYVLQMHQDADTSTVRVCSISEFTLAQPCLSFSVLDASRRRLHKLPDQEDGLLGEVTTGEVYLDDDEEVEKKLDGPDVGVVVKMYSVHTRALQELHIAFKPETTVPFPPTPSMSIVSHDGLKDTLSDMSMDTLLKDESAASHSDMSHSVDSSHHSSNSAGNNISYHGNDSKLSHQSVEENPILLAPDAFTSPRKVESSAAVRESVGSSSSSSFTHVTAMDEESSMTPRASDLKQQLPTTLPFDAVTMSQFKEPAINSGSIFAAAAQHIGPMTVQSPQASDAVSSAILTDTGSLSEQIEAYYSGDNKRNSRLSTGNSRQSTGSSSSTSLEVSEILEGVRPLNQEGQEEDEDDDDDEAEEGYLEDKEEVGEEEDEMEDAQVELHERSDNRPSTPENQSKFAEHLPESPYNAKIWPPPPEVGVNLEAKRLATDAITRAASLHLRTSRDKDDELGPQQEEGDVEIEEEKEEDICDENEHFHLPPPKATSSEVEETLSSIESPLRKLKKPSQSNIENAAKSENEAILDGGSFSQLQTSIQKVMSMLHYQQREIESLRSELHVKQRASDAVVGLQTQIDNLEGALASRVAASLNEHTHLEKERIQELLCEKESLEKQKQERLLNTVSATLDRTISSRLDRSVKEEMRSRVIPALARSLDPLKEQLHTEMAQKLTATDQIMKENIGKIIRSRQTAELIGQAAGAVLQAPIHGIVRDIVLPGFEGACQAIFRQMNDSFQRGLHEYVSHVKLNVEQVKKVHEDARDPIVNELRSMVAVLKKKDEDKDSFNSQLTVLQNTLQTGLKKMHSHQLEHQQHMDKCMKSLEHKLKNEVHSVIKEELKNALEDHQANINDSMMECLRSSAATPAPSNTATTPDPAMQQAKIVNLLQHGQLNEAFQVALSASDLSLVVYVCESVDPRQVFGQEPCPLQQPVLLSLIQQLSANLIDRTELKHKYLEEAVMNLDTTNPITREHSTTILGGLTQKLRTFVQNHPSETMTRNIKMLLMATQSLLK